MLITIKKEFNDKQRLEEAIREDTKGCLNFASEHHLKFRRGKIFNLDSAGYMKRCGEIVGGG